MAVPGRSLTAYRLHAEPLRRGLGHPGRSRPGRGGAGGAGPVRNARAGGRHPQPPSSDRLPAYMRNHCGAGWATQGAADLAGAEGEALARFETLAPVAATRNVLLPVGADHVIPSRWATAIHRDWNSRYVWPRFVTALPREFFAAVRADAAQRDIWLTPQTRDMNPVYP